MADEHDDDKGTALPESDSGTDKGQQSDSPPDTGQQSTPPDVELDDDGKPLPFDKHPKWKAARQAEALLGKLMADNDVSDPEELMQLLESGKKVVGKVDVDSLEEIMEKAATLDRYNAYWEQQKELRQREGETADETIARLEKENEAQRRQLTATKQTEDAAKALKGFETAATAIISDSLKGSSPQEIKLAKMLMGIDNPVLDIDINNKVAISKAVKEGVKIFESVRQRIIQDYLSGKTKIPDVPKGGSDTASAPTGVKTLKEARKVFLDTFK